MKYGKLAVVLLSILASEKSDSTNSIIADYILNHVNDIQHWGVQELANHCNVSISSISRFCKEIGLESFAELKWMLTQHDTFDDSNNLDSNFHKRLETYDFKIKNAIHQVTHSISEDFIQEIIEDIFSFEKIAAFGLMKAETAALILQSDLLHYGKKIFTHLSFKEQINYIKQADSQTLIIIFSYTNSYFDYLPKNLFSNKNNIPKIWVITGSTQKRVSLTYTTLGFDSDLNHYSHPTQLNLMATIIAQEFNYHNNN